MKKIIAVTAFTLMCGSAFAQSTGAPAAAQSDMNKPGMTNSGAINNSPGATTGNSMGSDASKQGAPTGAPVDAKGTGTQPGNVRDGQKR
ncbi:hypothetical protein [Bradyrhizobium sp. JYMT SZCCT0428]|uniref:hypothetical protein n=1 Tax=Bradyrhizobium sp. JYMT SZCCT0428 TaxID=2807673 RepID=UPI001BA9466D|nr:hypothetical protein [Bradyrhizobium sp. JYMT SZCCT0428]MBR1153145.1 hypothetical protein [Bradyrhizobium sp. JYMT SZCCT0428]